MAAANNRRSRQNTWKKKGQKKESLILNRLGIALEERSSLLNFEFMYDCKKGPGLVNELVSYE